MCFARSQRHSWNSCALGLCGQGLVWLCISAEDLTGLEVSIHSVRTNKRLANPPWRSRTAAQLPMQVSSQAVHKRGG